MGMLRLVRCLCLLHILEQNYEKEKEMTDQEIRNTIAHYCKWVQAPFDPKYFYVPILGPNEKMRYPLLDPFHDLNACKAASDLLDQRTKDQYVTMVFDYAQECAEEVSPNENSIKEPWGQFAIDLCAEKRAEFLAIVIKGIKQ